MLLCEAFRSQKKEEFKTNRRFNIYHKLSFLHPNRPIFCASSLIPLHKLIVASCSYLPLSSPMSLLPSHLLLSPPPPRHADLDAYLVFLVPLAAVTQTPRRAVAHLKLGQAYVALLPVRRDDG